MVRRIAFLLALVLTTGPVRTRAAGATEKPRLVVGIVIDQFRYDYLERFGDLFDKGGFRRLMQEGAVFTDAQYLHSQTVTSVGHTTFMTGSIPSYTGIIANEWYERTEGKIVRSVADDTVQTVGSASGRPSSPRRLVGSTLGDELKISNAGASRVVGVSIKDAPAILTTGHHPDGAYWFDPASGRFITSTYYMKQLPVWVEQFNAKKIPAKFLGREWTKLRPEPDYARSGIDDSPYERPPGGHRVFPHPVDNYDQFMESPFSKDALEAFAKAAIEGENLGGHKDSDLLIPKPYWVVSDKTTGHGTPYSFDTNVPVIFWGTWFAPGRYVREASPADIAPTLASILRITRPSGAVGRVLAEAPR